MGKNDAAIGLLKNIGYLTVRVPRQNLKPLQVFEKTGTRLVYRGELVTLFKNEVSDPPPISEDEQMSNVNGHRSSSQKIGVGISILGNIIGALGGSKLGLEVGFEKSASGEFEFHNVLGNSIEPFKLEEFLSTADINPALPASAKLLEADKLFVISAVIKSNKFGFETKNSSGQAVKVDVPVIQQIVGGSVNVATAGGSDTKITFEGSHNLVFGIKAMQMIYDEGKFKLLKATKPEEGVLEAMPNDEERSQTDRVENFQLLEINGPFIGIEEEFETTSVSGTTPKKEMDVTHPTFQKNNLFSAEDPLQEVLMLTERRDLDAAEVDKLAARAERRDFNVELSARPSAPKILAEGDSWFAYPREYILFGAPANIIHHLRSRGEFVIENTSSSGDEAVAMLTGSSKINLLKKMNERYYDLLLFSGGGNDIVGAYDMDFFLKQKTAGMNALDCLDEERLERRLRQVEDAYRDLLDYVSTYSKNPNLKVVTHTYDYVLPNAQGASFLGGRWDYDKGRSWMYPFMVMKGITETSDQRAIARRMLEKFQNMISKLAVEEKYKDKFYVAATQGTLAENDWLNEIHPNTDGFKLIERKIYDVIKTILK